MKGIDIYHGDGNPLKPIPAQAYMQSDFVIVKATQGTSYSHTSYFKTMIEKVLKDGKLAGAYHYAAGGDPEKEAAYFLSVVKPYLGKIILCLDWEKIQNKAWGDRNWCKTFINHIKAETGVKTFLYTGLDGCKYNEGLAGKVPLWFAGYPNNLNTWTVPNFKYNLGVWRNYDIWQYTSSGERCDRNVTDLTKKQWQSYAKGGLMLEDELRKEVVNTLVMMQGIKEGSAEHKLIIKTFNDSGLCPRHKMTTKDAWCATTVSFAFIVNKLAGKPGSGKLFECVECSCQKMIELGKKQGIFIEDDSYVPKTGDVIFYDWQDLGTGDNKGASDHVGIVEKVSGGVIKVIEGNKNDAIGTRQVSVNGKYIRGYIAPKYEKYAIIKETGYTGKLPKLPVRGYYKKGDGITTLTTYRDQIKLVQKALNWAINAGLSIDGQYGKNTDKAVEKLQRKYGLTINGCYGNKCQGVIKNLKK